VPFWAAAEAKEKGFSWDDWVDWLELKDQLKRVPKRTRLKSTPRKIDLALPMAMTDWWDAMA
jgi:hypothetical protein